MVCIGRVPWFCSRGVSAQGLWDLGSRGQGFQGVGGRGLGALNSLEANL